MPTRYDFIAVKADVSPEGWIRDRPVITRSGIFTYYIDGKQIHEYRPEEEVFKVESLSSLRGVPITDGHRGMVNTSNSDGIVGTVLSGGERQDDNVVADVIIHDAKKLGTKRELSLGYHADIDETPGEWNGRKYHQVQRNIKYNHLATVSRGRAGNARLRLDASDGVSEPYEMEDTMPENPQSKLVTLRLDEIDYQSAPEVVNAYKKSLEANTALQKRFDALEAERDSFKAKIMDADKRIDEIRKEARAAIQLRLQIEEVAGQHSLKFDEADTDIDLMRKVVSKIRPNLDLSARSDEYIRTAYDFAVEMEDDKNKKVSGQKMRVDGGSRQPVSDVPSSVAARQKMIAAKLQHNVGPKQA